MIARNDHLHGNSTNVAHVSFSLRTGGMEKLLVEFARHANRGRYSLHFFCLDSLGPLADDIVKQGWDVSSLDKREGFRPGAVVRLALALKRRNINVVHTHNSGAMIYGALASRLAGVKAVVHTRHGQRFGAGKRQTRVFALTARLVDRFVGVSQDGASLSVKEGVPSSCVRTIWNGIDLSQFPYQGATAGGPAVIVARIVPEKEIATLIRATALVRQRHPSFRLQIVGDGPSLPEVKGLVAELGLADSIELLGERRDIPSILSSASMFVLPSRTEGISLTLLEAMASGLPVVATRVGGNPEVVKHNRTGLLTKAGDVRQMADAISLMIETPSAASRMGECGRRRVERHFNVQRMVRNYEAMYREVLHEQSTPKTPSARRLVASFA